MSVLEQQLVREVESVPEFLKQEVLDFVMFLKEKHLKKGIQKTPGVCGGEACVGETRLAVWMLVEARRAGCTDEEFCRITLVLIRAAWQMHGPMPQAMPRRLERQLLKIPGIDGALLFERKFPEAGCGGFTRDRA